MGAQSSPEPRKERIILELRNKVLKKRRNEEGNSRANDLSDYLATGFILDFLIFECHKDSE